MDGFANPNAGGREETDERLHGSPPGSSQRPSCHHQPSNVLVAAEVGRCAAGARREQPVRRYLVAGFQSLQVAGESPHHRQPLAPPVGMAAPGARPGERRGPLAAVDLRLLDPVTQGLAPDPQLAGHPGHHPEALATVGQQWQSVPRSGSNASGRDPCRHRRRAGLRALRDDHGRDHGERVLRAVAPDRRGRPRQVCAPGQYAPVHRADRRNHRARCRRRP
jgi:hypothetical protein